MCGLVLQAGGRLHSGWGGLGATCCGVVPGLSPPGSLRAEGPAPAGSCHAGELEDPLPGAGWPYSISPMSTGASQLGWGVRHPPFGSDFCQGTVEAEQSRGAFSPKETNTAFPECL